MCVLIFSPHNVRVCFKELTLLCKDCHADVYMYIQSISEISKVLNVMFERNVMNCCVTSDKYFFNLLKRTAIVL